jgi:hypothetical protein
MTNQHAIDLLHSVQPMKIKKTNLKELLKEVPAYKWPPFEAILIHDLFLTKRQIAHLNRLLGE